MKRTVSLTEQLQEKEDLEITAQQGHLEGA